MSLSDDWRRLVAALTGRPDTAEEARLAALFQNRSELKKELKALDDERHRLLDRLKLQEGSTMRVEEQLANLEQYLGRPEEGQKSLAYFQLRAVWRSASRRLEQFATELVRQQKDRERRQQLADFERNKRNRLDDVDREVYEARILVDQVEAEQAARRERLTGLRGFWNYFRRRTLAQVIAEGDSRTDIARTALTDLSDQRHAIESETPPTSVVVAHLVAKLDVPVFGGLGGVGLLDELLAGSAGAMTGFSHPAALAAVFEGTPRGRL